MNNGKNNLETVRKEIDKVDKELSSLLQKRMDLVSKVVESKAQTGKEVLDKSVKKKLFKCPFNCQKQEYKDNVKAIFECIMYNSREYQKKLLESKSIKPRYAVIGENYRIAYPRKYIGIIRKDEY